MLLAFHLPAPPATPTESPGPGRAAAAVRQAARAALAGAKPVYRGALVLGVFALLLAATLALRLLIWLPLFHNHV